jgi:hypothetical protein
MSGFKVGFLRVYVVFPYAFAPHWFTSLTGWRLWLCLLFAGYFPAHEDFDIDFAWGGGSENHLDHLLWILHAWGYTQSPSLDDIPF